MANGARKFAFLQGNRAEVSAMPGPPMQKNDQTGDRRR
jgi:hypothetical protein